MKIYKLILLTILISFTIGCSSNRNIDKKNQLTNALKSEIFKDFFELCREKKDTIIVYNNLNRFKNFEQIINCNKIILIKNSKIKVDVNSMDLIREDKIVFYKYEIKKDTVKLFFINIASNAHLDILINKKNNIIKYKSGIY